MVRVFAAILLASTVSTAPAGDWVQFVNETDMRLISDPSVGIDDQAEKDYAWGDVDKDGDIDLICVRKQPFTTTGKRTNVLFLNEDGALVDRTAEFATASDIPGDQGFLTPTNDRDVVLVDVNNDGWLDIVTAPTLTDNQAKHLSHPRIYMNLGEDGEGNWLGFEYQDARIPEMHPDAGPRFCSVSAGDLTGDGFADLYFGDYDAGGGQIFDYNNKLLINDGNGFFTDESTLRMTETMLLSAFSAASAIADMNNDGAMDVVKHTSLAAPTHVAIAYNDTENEGFFVTFDVLYNLSPYFITVGDLNGDEVMDIVVVDDGTDRFLRGTNLDSQGRRNYEQGTFPGSNGFGGNAIIADLNNDGRNDVIITDVHVDLPGCSRSTHIYENLGGETLSFLEHTDAIPEDMRIGWHDVAAMDINGDGWLDLVAGRCGGTQIWMNVPPYSIGFEYPQGLPDVVVPNEETIFEVQLSPAGQEVEPGTPMLHTAVDGGPFVATPMESLGAELYQAMLPGAPCLSLLRFYVSAELTGGTLFTDPPDAPSETFHAIPALGSEITFSDSIEGDVSGWMIVSDESLTTGEWEQAEPNGTISGESLAAPDEDATPGEGNVMAFVTQNCVDDCELQGQSDVDGGPTYLISPSINLEGNDARIIYSRWFFTNSVNGEDFLSVEVSNNDGATWEPVHTTLGTGSAWEVAEFRVGDYVTPTTQVRVRFGVEDVALGSIVEAGIDDFQVEQFTCEGGEPCGGCPTDANGDLETGPQDLASLLACWGPLASGCECLDTNYDSEVGPFDLATLLAAWGPCP